MAQNMKDVMDSMAVANGARPGDKIVMLTFPIPARLIGVNTSTNKKGEAVDYQSLPYALQGRLGNKPAFYVRGHISVPLRATEGKTGSLGKATREMTDAERAALLD